MSEKDFHLHNGEHGAALAIRIIPRARENQVAEVLNDGTVKIRLTESGENLNQALRRFLSQLLDVNPELIEIVAGESGRDKLVSILDMEPKKVQTIIIANLA